MTRKKLSSQNRLKQRNARAAAMKPSKHALLPKIPAEFTNHVRHQHFAEIRKANREPSHKPAE